MPSGRTHLIAGALAGSICMYAVDAPATTIIASAVGGILPDIDHRHSMLGRFCFLWLICRHRGFTHSLLALGVVAVSSLLLLPTDWCFGLVLGYSSHLLLDYLTPMGIPLTWPNPKRFSIRRW